jgi:hypothetical protein
MIRADSRGRAAVFLAVLWAVSATGCSAPAVQVGKTDEAVLIDRAEARWAALIEADFARAYEFESPAYRDVHTLRMFVSQFGGAVGWTAAEVLGVASDASGEAASVTVLISYQAMDAGGGVMDGQRPVDERWVRTGGEWWHAN